MFSPKLLFVKLEIILSIFNFVWNLSSTKYFDLTKLLCVICCHSHTWTHFTNALWYDWTYIFEKVTTISALTTDPGCSILFSHLFDMLLSTACAQSNTAKNMKEIWKMYELSDGLILILLCILYFIIYFSVIGTTIVAASAPGMIVHRMVLRPDTNTIDFTVRNFALLKKVISIPKDQVSW